MARIPQLDCLRAVAVLLVLGRHLTPAAPADVGPVAAALTTMWERGGWIGVDLFFVLSGFLVSGLLFREYNTTGQVRPGRFLIRRGFKIYPPFYFLIALTVALAPQMPRALIPELLFVQNYFGGMWGHTWSLAVEEHFYLLLAVGVWYAVRRRPAGDAFGALPVVFSLVAIGCLVGRFMAAQQPYSHPTLLTPTHLRIDALMFGVLLSYWWHMADLQRHARRWAWLLCVLGIGLLIPAFVWPLEKTWWIPVFGMTAFYCGAGLLLLGILSLEFPTTRLVRAVAAVGAYSYSIYLWHRPIERVALGMLLDASGWWAYAVAYVVGSVVIGILMSKAIEYPALGIRDRFFPSRERSAPTARVVSPAVMDVAEHHLQLARHFNHRSPKPQARE